MRGNENALRKWKNELIVGHPDNLILWFKSSVCLSSAQPPPATEWWGPSTRSLCSCPVGGSSSSILLSLLQYASHYAASPVGYLLLHETSNHFLFCSLSWLESWILATRLMGRLSNYLLVNLFCLISEVEEAYRAEIATLNQDVQQVA